MATLYFNAAVNSDWNTLGNWWTNSSHTNPASSLPTSADDVIITLASQGSAIINTGSKPTINSLIFSVPQYRFINISIDVINDLIINDHAAILLASSKPITVGGSIIINDDGLLGMEGGQSSPNLYNTSIIFNDQSRLLYGTLIANPIFNDLSTNWGMVQGDATFNYLASTNGIVTDITGKGNGGVTGLTKDSAGNTITTWIFDSTSLNENSVTGNAIFNGSQSNNGSVSGNATFNGSSYNNGTVNGNATFNNLTAIDGVATSTNGYGSGIVSGLIKDSLNNIITTWNFTSTIINDITITGNVIIDGEYGLLNANGISVYGNVKLLNGGLDNGSITGNIELYNNSSIYNVNFLDDNAIATFYDYSNIYYDAGLGNLSCFFYDNSFNTGSLSGGTFNNYSENGGNIYGDCIFNDSSNNNGFIYCETCTFNQSATNTYIIEGNCTFNDNSVNSGMFAIITGNCYFNHSSQNNNTIDGNCEFTGSANNGGVISGNCIFYDLSSTIPASSIVGNCIFNDSSSTWSSSNITGDCVFNDSSLSNGLINASTVIFNDLSVNASTADLGYSSLTIFNDHSENESGYTIPNSIFNNYSINDGVVDNAVFNHNAYSTINSNVMNQAEFNDASYCEVTATDSATVNTFMSPTRTPYPLRYGINNSNILGLI